MKDSSSNKPAPKMSVFKSVVFSLVVLGVVFGGISLPLQGLLSGSLFVLNMFIVYAFATLGFIVTLYGGKILKTQKTGPEDLSSAERRLVAIGELSDLFYKSPWRFVAAVGIFVLVPIFLWTQGMGLIPLLASHYPMFKIVMGLLPVIEKAVICLVPVSVALYGLLRGLSKTGRENMSINHMLLRLSVVVFSLYVGLLAGIPLCPALGLSSHAMAVLNATLPMMGYAAAISTVLFIPARLCNWMMNSLSSKVSCSTANTASSPAQVAAANTAQFQPPRVDGFDQESGVNSAFHTL
jgi:hypothetical protein